MIFSKPGGHYAMNTDGDRNYLSTGKFVEDLTHYEFNGEHDEMNQCSKSRAISHDSDINVKNVDYSSLITKAKSVACQKQPDGIRSIMKDGDALIIHSKKAEIIFENDVKPVITFKPEIGDSIEIMLCRHVATRLFITTLSVGSKRWSDPKVRIFF